MKRTVLPELVRRDAVEDGSGTQSTVSGGGLRVLVSVAPPSASSADRPRGSCSGTPPPSSRRDRQTRLARSRSTARLKSTRQTTHKFAKENRGPTARPKQKYANAYDCKTK